jgi:uncharacterized lipoprotein YddW (UPF0748 family)
VLSLLLSLVVAADTVRLPPIPREFRGVWVATVGNIDWPSRPGLSAAETREELLTILDRAQALHLNAVIFQVRPAGDALYVSQLEPWSAFLTGRQGVAPAPVWDPLAFAVQEAHARGLELHAWFNPYRAKETGYKGPLSPLHMARRWPGAAKKYGDLVWMDPGEEIVRQHTVKVILDVVKRYDIDGVHIDDYFYPYPHRNWRGDFVPFPDDASYRKYERAGGSLERDAWRRNNVNLLVEALHREIRAVKPWVKFGISPFGIWRPGEPAGVEGFDAYENLFADARLWLREGWADYFAPQLYWPINAPAQGYGDLLRWWGEQNVFQRHLWPGNFTSRAGTRPDWPSAELINQVIVTRADKTATGNIHFSMKALLTNQRGVADSLASRVYTSAALIPASPWMPGQPPAAPPVRLVADGESRVLACLGDTTTPPRWWVLRLQQGGEWSHRILPGAVRKIAIAGIGAADTVALSAVDRTGRESAATIAESAPAC